MAKEGRNEKGQFVNGNKEGRRFRSDDGSATEMQLRSSEAQVQNRLVAEALRRALLGKDPDTGDPMIKSIVDGVTSRSRKTGTFGDLRIAADILGELEQKVTENVNMELKFKFGGE